MTIDDREKLDGFRRLERFVCAIIELRSPRADFSAAIAHEKSISQYLDGRSVLDDINRESNAAGLKQLRLFEG